MESIFNHKNLNYMNQTNFIFLYFQKHTNFSQLWIFADDFPTFYNDFLDF